MSYLTAFLIVAACAFAAAVASLIIGRLVPLHARREHHEVGVQVFLQLGVMFAVLLAFVFNEVWSEYNTAAQAINGECGALHGAAVLANALPDHAGRPVNRAIITYARTVIDKEWPAMAERKRSPEAAWDLRAAVDVAARLDSKRPADASVQGQILTLLAQAHAQRETRTFQITQSLPLGMWAVLILLALVLISFVLFACVEGVGHVLFASIFTGCTVMVLVLVRMLDFPFEGALTLSNGDFLKMLSEVSAIVALP